jgi:hypothetical protein
MAPVAVLSYLRKTSEEVEKGGTLRRAFGLARIYITIILAIDEREDRISIKFPLKWSWLDARFSDRWKADGYICVRE